MPIATAGDAASPSAWDRRRRLIRRDIELCALDLLAERGYDNVSTEELAAAAGVSTRTFFRYFPTKDDLLTAMPLRAAEAMCAAVRRRPAHESLLQAWRAVVAGADDWRQPEDVRAALQFRVMLERSPGVSRRFRSDLLLVPFVQVVAERLGVDPDEDVRPAVYGAAIQAALNMGMDRWAEGTADSLPALLTEMLDALATLPTAGQKAPAPRRKRLPIG